MSVRNINIPVNDELLFVLKKDEKDLQEELRRIIAMHFFEKRKISLGKAAELSGMNKDDFVTFLGRNKVDIFQYNDEELEREFKMVDDLVEESRNESSC